MATTKSKQSIYAIVIMVLFLLIPLFKISSLVDYTLIPHQLLGSLGTAVLLLLILFSAPKKTLPISWIVWSFLGFVAMNFVSVVAAINPVESWATISRYLLMFSFLVSVLFLFHHKLIRSSDIIKAVMLFGSLVAVITLFELFGVLENGKFFTDIYAVKATFGHKNLLSSALMLSLPFAIMGVATLNKLWKKGALILVFLLILEIFVLRTRGAWLSVFSATLVSSVLFMIGRRANGDTFKFPIKYVGLGVGLAVILIVALFSASGVQESVTDTTNLDKRVIFWQHSLEMAKEHPLTGVGAGNWKINFPGYGLGGLDYNVVQGITHVQRPHNDYLWVLSESGFLGLIFFLGIFVMAFVQLFKKLKETNSREDLAINLGVAFGLIAYLVFSLTDFPLERTSHNFLVVLLLALAYRDGIPSSKINLKSKAWIWLLLAAVGFSALVSSYRWQGEKNSKLVLEAYERRDVKAMVPSAEEALNSFYNMDNFANPVYYYSSLGKLFLKQPQDALEDGLLALEIAPNNIITIAQLANVYKAQDNTEEALRYYNLATAISPRFESGRFTKSEIFINQKKYVEAFEEIRAVNPYTKDPRMAQQLPFVMQELYKTRNQHGQYKGLMGFMANKQLKSQDDYMKLYYEFIASYRKPQKP